MRFQGTKKCPSEVQELHALVENTAKEVIRQNKHVKATSEHESGLEEEPENFNSKNISNGEEWENASGNQKNEAEVRGRGTEAR